MRIENLSKTKFKDIFNTIDFTKSLKELNIKKYNNFKNNLDIIYYDNIILKKPWYTPTDSQIKNISTQHMYSLNEKKSLGISSMYNLYTFASS